MKRKQKPEHCATTPDVERLGLDLQSPDAATRARAVRALCPCHGGWQLFEQHIQAVVALQKDDCPLVRAAALHVFEDAAEMESGGYPTNPREVTNDMLRTRRASRFPREPEEITPRTQARERARAKKR